MQIKTNLDFTVKYPEWPSSKVQITTNAGEYLGNNSFFF